MATQINSVKYYNIKIQDKSKEGRPFDEERATDTSPLPSLIRVSTSACAQTSEDLSPTTIPIEHRKIKKDEPTTVFRNSFYAQNQSGANASSGAKTIVGNDGKLKMNLIANGFGSFKKPVSAFLSPTPGIASKGNKILPMAKDNVQISQAVTQLLRSVFSRTEDIGTLQKIVDIKAGKVKFQSNLAEKMFNELENKELHRIQNENNLLQRTQSARFEDKAQRK